MEEKIFEHSFAESEERIESYADFVAIVKQLRRDCPWDQAQTHESVKHLLIEEAYEVVEAIDRGDLEELKKELGDILLHVVFHSVIAEENSSFTLQDVIESETEKLVRRHPHVFGDVEATDSDTVLRTWEATKQKEKKGGSALDGVPAQLPALLRAQRVQEKAAGVGFDFPEASDAWQKVEEEVQELQAATAEGDDDAIEDELGDVLFAFVNYARFLNANPENALRRTLDKFTRRFALIEEALRARGEALEDASLEEMDQLWDSVKAEEQA